jgi:hypothetical protein
MGSAIQKLIREDTHIDTQKTRCHYKSAFIKKKKENKLKMGRWILSKKSVIEYEYTAY